MQLTAAREAVVAGRDRIPRLPAGAGEGRSCQLARVVQAANASGHEADREAFQSLRLSSGMQRGLCKLLEVKDGDLPALGSAQYNSCPLQSGVLGALCFNLKNFFSTKAITEKCKFNV